MLLDVMNVKRKRHASGIFARFVLNLMSWSRSCKIYAQIQFDILILLDFCGKPLCCGLCAALHMQSDYLEFVSAVVVPFS